MKMSRVLALALASAPFVFSAQVQTGVWYEFSFEGPGSPGAACTGCVPSFGTPTDYAPDAPWTFTLAGPGTLKVTDAFLAGDVFRLFIDGNDAGTTSAPGAGDCWSDPVTCLADPSISSGMWMLGPGNYSLMIVAEASPHGGGAAYFMVQDAVPEPGTWALALAGAVGLGIARRLKR